MIRWIPAALALVLWPGDALAQSFTLDLGDGAEIPAGQPSTFTFTADTAGRFELESHDTHDVIMILDVL